MLACLRTGSWSRSTAFSVSGVFAATLCITLLPHHGLLGRCVNRAQLGFVARSNEIKFANKEVQYLVSGKWEREPGDKTGQRELEWLSLRELKGVKGYKAKINSYFEGLQEGLEEAEAELDEEEEDDQE